MFSRPLSSHWAPKKKKLVRALALLITLLFLIGEIRSFILLSQYNHILQLTVRIMKMKYVCVCTWEVINWRALRRRRCLTGPKLSGASSTHIALPVMQSAVDTDRRDGAGRAEQKRTDRMSGQRKCRQNTRGPFHTDLHTSEVVRSSAGTEVRHRQKYRGLADPVQLRPCQRREMFSNLIWIEI